MLSRGSELCRGSALLSCEAGMYRKAFDRILAFTRPRDEGGVVFGTKAFGSLCDCIVLQCL